MNDPRRLLDGDASPQERALLQAAEADEPATGAEQRLLLSLGLLDLPPVSASSAPVAKAALGKSLLALSGKWLLLAGVGAGLWWVVEPSKPTTVDSARPVQHSEPGLAVPDAEMHSDPPPDSTLAREVAALDRARRALVGGDQRGALALLTDYQRAHPSGILEQEATVLRIEALLAAHDEQGARSAAAVFLRAHPQSPHAARLQTLLNGEGPKRAR